jgi:hypothetical protein
MSEESIETILQLPRRKLVVAQNEIDLSLCTENEILILIVEESKGSAGGRGGGSGSRRIDKIFAFSCHNGHCFKFFETTEKTMIEQFEIPYSAVAMDIKLHGGTPLVVQGITDPEYVARSLNLISKLK